MRPECSNVAKVNRFSHTHVVQSKTMSTGAED